MGEVGMKEGMKIVLYFQGEHDDQLVFVEVLAAVNPNLRCEFVRDRIEVFEKLKLIDTPVCIYADLNMPRPTGLQLLRALKFHPVNSQIPVFVLPTSSSSSDKIIAAAWVPNIISLSLMITALLFYSRKTPQPFTLLPEVKKAS
jgi:CheY-like chemotaxis protein